ncbi:hypothetical protein [Flavobacterium sp. N502540]|uniref:hypothetical protein n=1 Tax=Flavobacterium sp. N502540 TaxID=2986838 RepID=UPI002224074A|nr:hypothetical protein [Flavobacterium sp. N502540]
MVCKKIISGVFFSLLVFACQNKNSLDSTLKKKPVSKATNKQTTPLQSAALKKDTLGSEITEFLENYNYVIQYEAVGFLNQDNFKDKVLILQEDEEYKSLARITLVLLGNKQGFELYKKSYTIMPPEYNADNYKKFDVEDVAIENNKIVFDLSAVGPNGHISFEFIFQNNGLQLHEFTGYFMGAGSHTEYVYKPKNQTDGTLEETTINTMEDDMPSTTKAYKIRLKSPADFENFDYDKFLNEIIQQAN